MSPSASAAPLPPLPSLSGAGSSPDAGAGGQDSQMAQIMSGVAPVKMAVDGILQSCKQIVQSGAVPGSEQVCGQIIALATSLLPMAVQQAMVPGGGGGGGVGGQGAGQVAGGISPVGGGPGGGGVAPIGA